MMLDSLTDLEAYLLYRRRLQWKIENSKMKPAIAAVKYLAAFRLFICAMALANCCFLAAAAAAAAALAVAFLPVTTGVEEAILKELRVLV